MRTGQTQHVPDSSNRSLYLNTPFDSSSPEVNFGGNKLLNGSISRSPQNRAQRTVCMKVSPAASTRVSPDSALLKLRSPSFESQHSFFKHFQDHWRLQVHMSKHSLSLRLLHTQTQPDTQKQTHAQTQTQTQTQTHDTGSAREPAGNAPEPKRVRCVMGSRALQWNVLCAVYVSCIWSAVSVNLYALHHTCCMCYATPAVRPPRENPKCICLSIVAKRCMEDHEKQN